MVIYKTKMFKNSFKKMPINDADLIDIANEVHAGYFEADLGGGIRTIIFYKQGNNLFFADGWKKYNLSSKKAKEITDDELESYKDLAKDLFSATKNKIDKMIALGLLTEVKHD